MFLSELLLQLTSGAVGDLAIGGGGTGVIPPLQLDALGLKIDAALTHLHTRFPLRLKTQELQTYAGRYVYPLEQAFAQTSGSLEPQKFILDTVTDVFQADVLAIERIFDSEHNPLPLNDRQASTSWFTVKPTVLAMDYPVDDTHYFVEFRARHPKVNAAAEDPSSEVIDIPEALVSALVARIGYEVFCTQSGENALLKAQELRDRSEYECSLVDSLNTLNSSVVDTNVKLGLGGWI